MVPFDILGEKESAFLYNLCDGSTEQDWICFCQNLWQICYSPFSTQFPVRIVSPLGHGWEYRFFWIPLSYKHLPKSHEDPEITGYETVNFGQGLFWVIRLEVFKLLFGALLKSLCAISWRIIDDGKHRADISTRPLLLQKQFSFHLLNLLMLHHNMQLHKIINKMYKGRVWF